VSTKVSLRSTWKGRFFAASLILIVSMGLLGIRAAVAQAVFFSFDDVSDADGKARAIEEARVNLAAVSQILEDDDSATDQNMVGHIEAFVFAGTETVDLAENDEAGLAESARITTVEPTFATLSGELGAIQADLAALVIDSEQTAGRISRVTFVAIAFLIPAITMVAFWLILRRRMREREAEMEASLEAEKELNRAKDEFIAGLSHELRTPLTTIVGFSEILGTDPSLDADAREQLGFIQASSADLSRMVADLLTAARLDASALNVQPQVLDLAEEVGAATAAYQRAGEDLEIQVPSIEAYADPLHVRQVVHNLVSNALRHGGGRVMVSGTEKVGSAVLVVADNGPGVTPEMEERLFKRFFHEGRQALVSGSVGLGLAISQELAMQMGGSLRYQRVDGWTIFTLRLPALPKHESRRRELLLAGAKAAE
jgi:signal transduction histidine kinase